jgi:hypothetical protein
MGHLLGLPHDDGEYCNAIGTECRPGFMNTEGGIDPVLGNTLPGEENEAFSCLHPYQIWIRLGLGGFREPPAVCALPPRGRVNGIRRATKPAGARGGPDSRARASPAHCEFTDLRPVGSPQETPGRKTANVIAAAGGSSARRRGRVAHFEAGCN